MSRPPRSARHTSALRFTPHALALAASLCSAAAASQAQTLAEDAPNSSVQQLERTVVTATRSSKALEKIPGAVSVIGRQDIETQSLISEDPSQLLTLQIPGYAPARQKMSNFGEGLRGRTALLLLDGIPQTNPLRFGGREGYFADPMIVERIEVVSGASAAQGMGATGGIINTITRSPRRVGTQHLLELKLGSQGHSDSSSWKTGYRLEHLSEGPDPWSALVYLGQRSQDVGVDGEGRMLATESLHKANDAFIKLGQRLGDQELQLMFNQFTAHGFEDWVDVPGDRARELPASSKPGRLDYQPLYNRSRSASLSWSHADLAQGQAQLQLFAQRFAARYSGGVIATFQDAAIAPLNTLVDQSQIEARKWGLRASWVRQDLWTPGLELTLGLDVLDDVSQQDLTLTGRAWVPPLKFRSTAPFAQLEYEFGPLTLRGGLRDEHTQLQVDSYNTLAFYGKPRVQGGERRASEMVKSLGAVWRFGRSGWSSFVAYNEGFGPPDVGLILRAVKAANSSVTDLVDLQPIVTQNRELGLAWRGRLASVSASVYESRSDLGSQLIVSNGIGTVQRVPITVRGMEVSGEWRPSEQLKLSSSYARTRGRTSSTSNGGALDLDLGARSQGPDKWVAAATWQFAPQWSSQLSLQRQLPRHANVGKFSGKTSLEEHFKGVTLVDASLSWNTAQGQWSAGVENLFNRQYITYYSQAHYAGTPEDFYAGRGRGLNLSWRRPF